MFSGYFYIADIIENRDVLMTIIMMLKFTQSLTPTLNITIHNNIADYHICDRILQNRPYCHA